MKSEASIPCHKPTKNDQSNRIRLGWSAQHPTKPTQHIPVVARDIKHKKENPVTPSTDDQTLNGKNCPQTRKVVPPDAAKCHMPRY